MATALGIGIVGAGRIGQLAHLANFSAIADCQVVALAELRPELGRQAAERFAVPKVYADHRALLENPQVDAVVVVTRRHATGPIVLDALNAGRHVLSEKPMCHSLERGQQLVAAAERANRRYAVGFMKRHDPGTVAAKAMLDELNRSGELGQMVLVRGWCFCGDIGVAEGGFDMTEEPRPDGLELWPNGPDWMPEAERDEYDWFLNVDLHLINALRHLLGDGLEVESASLGARGGRLASLRLGELPVALELGEVESTDWDEGVEVLFEKGRLRLRFPPPLRPDRTASATLEAAGQALRVLHDGSGSPDGSDWAFRRQAEAFVRDARDGLEPLASGADSLGDLALSEALWRRHLDHSESSPACTPRRQTG